MNKLDQLQGACEKVLLSLRDRKTQFSIWHEPFADRCQKLTEILLKGGSVCPICHPEETDEVVREIDDMKG